MQVRFRHRVDCSPYYERCDARPEPRACYRRRRRCMSPRNAPGFDSRLDSRRWSPARQRHVAGNSDASLKPEPTQRHSMLPMSSLAVGMRRIIASVPKASS